MNKSKIVERSVKEYVGRREQFKKRKCDLGVGASPQRSLKTTTIVEQSQAQTSLGGARSNSSRGMGSPRSRGSWRLQLDLLVQDLIIWEELSAIGVELRDI